ncbi:glutamate synthase-related protein [Kitasatospora mediocidica]|uniref:glutamate synthase-related protein n=1 Tax=Kitasatospora mediocidica TaxID=58352 RepID=UPI0005604679|nr:glutamate synthase-related protein [Kitasatospora mediocidica]
MTGVLSAPGFPEASIRSRARDGARGVFPPMDGYGLTLFGAGGVSRPGTAEGGTDPLDAMRLVPPVFMPQRLEMLTELAREPLYGDVALDTEIGGFRSPLPFYVSAFGSTQVSSSGLGLAVSRQAGRLGIPLVIGENVVPTNGYADSSEQTGNGMLARLRAYESELPDGLGGMAFQQSTEDADAEVWNLLYSDPGAQPLLESGRLAFELKVGQGAKPGLGGMTVLQRATADRLAGQYSTDESVFDGGEQVLRCSSPGTFTAEILRQQIRFMRNNYPRARVWVKLPPGRDIHDAAQVAWASGADSVTVDGAEGGSGWAPSSFLDQVGLPLAECLRRLGSQPRSHCLLVSGRMWEGARAVKSLALGARAVGLGRAALLAADEDPEEGLARLVACLALETRMLISSLGKYRPAALDQDDVWLPGATGLGHLA